jgi:hypothetical protein
MCPHELKMKPGTIAFSIVAIVAVSLSIASAGFPMVSVLEFRNA